MTERVCLRGESHRVYELDDGLLLVFKPAGHVEPQHAHAYEQRLRVLRGQLRIIVEGSTVVLDEHSAPLRLSAEQRHDTAALENTWLIAEAKR